MQLSSGLETYCDVTLPSASHCYSAPGLLLYDETGVNEYSNDVCGVISENLKEENPIYGSGCAPGTVYSFCHGPVGKTRKAFSLHLNDSSSRYIGAVTGTECDDPGPPPLASNLVGAEQPSQTLGGAYRVFSGPTKLPVTKAVTDLAEQDNSHKAGRLADDGEIDVTQARAVGASGTVWAIPSQTGLCAALALEAGTAVIVCTDTAHESLLTATTDTSAGYLVWGLASNTTKSIHVKLGSGTDAAVPVTSNGFSAVFKERPTETS